MTQPKRLIHREWQHSTSWGWADVLDAKRIAGALRSIQNLTPEQEKELCTALTGAQMDEVRRTVGEVLSAIIGTTLTSAQVDEVLDKCAIACEMSLEWTPDNPSRKHTLSHIARLSPADALAAYRALDDVTRDAIDITLWKHFSGRPSCIPQAAEIAPRAIQVKSNRPKNYHACYVRQFASDTWHRWKGSRPRPEIKWTRALLAIAGFPVPDESESNLYRKPR